MKTIVIQREINSFQTSIILLITYLNEESTNGKQCTCIWEILFSKINDMLQRYI